MWQNKKGKEEDGLQKCVFFTYTLMISSKDTENVQVKIVLRYAASKAKISKKMSVYCSALYYIKLILKFGNCHFLTLLNCIPTLHRMFPMFEQKVFWKHLIEFPDSNILFYLHQSAVTCNLSYTSFLCMSLSSYITRLSPIGYFFARPVTADLH